MQPSNTLLLLEHSINQLNPHQLSGFLLTTTRSPDARPSVAVMRACLIRVGSLPSNECRPLTLFPPMQDGVLAADNPQNWK